MKGTKKTEIARAIEKWGKSHDLLYDTRIYFSNKAWNYDSSGNRSIIKDVKATDYLQYGNDDTLSMSFEGPLHFVFEHGWSTEEGRTRLDEFHQLMDGLGVWFERGNSWNLSIYED